MEKGFTEAYQKLQINEGGYSNHQSDRGGETYCGISRVFHPNWAGWKLIDQVKGKGGGEEVIKGLGNIRGMRTLVELFYFENYWEALNLDFFPYEIADELFDCAVNQGIGYAVQCLQEALNLLNNNGTHYRDIIVDGVLGNITKGVFVQFMNTKKLKGRTYLKNVEVLHRVIIGLRFVRYKNIVERHPDQEVFFFGWVNRAFDD